ncbi:MAG: ABC transporter ATP-binding protein [Acidimicrobiales bacterium]
MPPDDAAVLTVSEVGVRFGGVAALNATSLTVNSGTVTGLIGPNGAGKTTLFNVISGLQSPDRGTVSLYDTDVTSMRPHLRARLGLARTFQRLEVFGSLTVSENVQVGLEASGERWGRIGRRARLGATIDSLLDRVGLIEVASEQSSNLPTGLARMVELARALAICPRLLLLDEPGSGLDESESVALGALLTSLAAEGMAVLLVEHDMELVMRICDHIYVLDFGDIICSGAPEQVKGDPRVQAAYLGDGAPRRGALPRGGSNGCGTSAHQIPMPDATSTDLGDPSARPEGSGR